MTADHIAIEWAKFAEHVLPATAGEVQREETRKAFYAGAAFLFYRIQRLASPGPDVTEDDARLADEIMEEIGAWEATL